MITPFEVANLTVSKHAINRWRERTHSQADDFEVAEKLRRILYKFRSREVELKPQYRLIELLDHNFEHARYWTNGEHYIVVASNTIVTIHTGKAKRWQPVSTEPK